jgi:hypothetical protein
MKALSRRETPAKRHVALLSRFVIVLTRLQDRSHSGEDCAAEDREILLLSPEEMTESRELVVAAAYAFCVPENPLCSLLRPDENTLLTQLLDSWDDLSFQQRALLKEALLLLSTLFLPSAHRHIDPQGRGNFPMREAAIARMQLGL